MSFTEIHKPVSLKLKKEENTGDGWELKLEMVNFNFIALWHVFLFPLLDPNVGLGLIEQNQVFIF